MLHESGENYLETIYLLKKSIKEVRSIDVALKLNYSKASISRAVNHLKKSGYITIDDKGYIDFTSKGLERVERIYEKHQILTRFFMLSIDLDEKSAEEEACKIEHIISPETFGRIKKYVNDNLNK
jgi:DtxR family Mn-dependent transcriptional regulator